MKSQEQKELQMKYFVLKPTAKDAYDMYARASQDAMIVYSKRIRITSRVADQVFADQILCWAEKERANQDELCRAVNKII